MYKSIKQKSYAENEKRRVLFKLSRVDWEKCHVRGSRSGKTWGPKTYMEDETSPTQPGPESNPKPQRIGSDEPLHKPDA